MYMYLNFWGYISGKDTADTFLVHMYLFYSLCLVIGLLNVTSTFCILLRQYLPFPAFIYLTAVAKTQLHIIYHFVLFFFCSHWICTIDRGRENHASIYYSHFCLCVLWKRNNLLFQVISVHSIFFIFFFRKKK